MWHRTLQKFVPLVCILEAPVSNIGYPDLYMSFLSPNKCKSWPVDLIFINDSHSYCLALHDVCIKKKSRWEWNLLAGLFRFWCCLCSNSILLPPYTFIQGWKNLPPPRAAEPANNNTNFFFYLLLTVHPCIILFTWSQLGAQYIVVYLFQLIYMFGGNYVPIIRKTYCIYATMVFFTLYGWLSGLLQQTRQPPIQSKFSWWWAHSCLKHVVKLK